MTMVSTDWLHTLLAAMIAVALALVVLGIGRAVLLRLARGTRFPAAVLRRCEGPAYLVLPLIATQAVWHAAPDDLVAVGRVQHANGVLLLAAVTWLGLGIVRGVAEGMVAMHPVDVVDNLQARRIHTQTRVLARTAMVMVLLAGTALILMTFPGARQIGASLLASAGVAGLVVGIAARPLFSNLIAGLQIALAQPLRIDDVLIVQGEWGRVEEITGTYVVLRLWDQRRLIVPLQWFIENPFQNWTRASAEIIGTVFLRVDHRMPMEPLRVEAQRLCEASPDWDRRLCRLQMTEAGEHSVEVRVLVSALDSGRAWDLRCHVREGLVAYMQREHAQHLPVWRGVLADRQEEGVAVTVGPG
ncbi:MAG: mechanosensitive ion channel domain-containing protein [Burkholderiales bacterium]